MAADRPSPTVTLDRTSAVRVLDFLYDLAHHDVDEMPDDLRKAIDALCEAAGQGDTASWVAPDDGPNPWDPA